MIDDKDLNNKSVGVIEVFKDKGYKTPADLEREILELDPTYKLETKSNVVNFKKDINVDDVHLVTFNELSTDMPSPLEYVMYPIIPQQGIIFVYAATGVGKTLFTLNMAYAIAGGGNFLKYSCPKPRRILYVDGEMAYLHMHQRLMAISEQQGELDFKDNFFLMTPDKCNIRIPKLDEPIGQEIYLKLIEKYDIEVIVFDNLSTLSLFDENKANEWTVIQDYQVMLRSKGKTVINVHHAGKDKNGYRGTSKMLDVADLAISLQPQIEDQVDDNPAIKKFKIVYQKPRLLVGKDSLPFEVTLNNGQWSYQSIEVSILDRVADCVKAGMSQREIAKEMFLSQPTVNRMIKKLKSFGRIDSQ